LRIKDLLTLIAFCLSRFFLCFINVLLKMPFFKSNYNLAVQQVQVAKGSKLPRNPVFHAYYQWKLKEGKTKGTSIGLYNETACKHYLRHDEAQNSL